MNWSKWIRQFHRWVSIAFTMTVIANIVALSTGDGALDERLRCVGSEVAEVGRVPQSERGDGAVFDEVAHLSYVAQLQKSGEFWPEGGR